MIMGLFVPVFRVAMVLLNVWESYKTLKPPPPSKRNGGKPSVRAASQRKRDMKGCLTIWIVWCMYAVYERTFDSTVRFFVPFYDEFKSVLLLGLIVARARLAEPIFLHIVRPILKPYAPTIDFVLDHTASIGDFIALLISIPIEMIGSFLPRSWHADEQDTNSRESAFLGEFENQRVQSEQPKSYSGMPQPSGPYQVWHPSPLHRDEHVENPSFANIYQGPPTPPLEQQAAPPSVESDEWRPYPTFPSAYAPMPHHKPALLASSMAPLHTQPSTSDEDDAGYDVQPPSFPWPNQYTAPEQSMLPPGFRPSVQQ